MYKVKSEEIAKQLASENKNPKRRYYGHSIFNGFWYVGGKEEIKNIGVVEIKQIDENKP